MNGNIKLVVEGLKYAGSGVGVLAVVLAMEFAQEPSPSVDVVTQTALNSMAQDIGEIKDDLRILTSLQADASNNRTALTGQVTNLQTQIDDLKRRLDRIEYLRQP